MGVALMPVELGPQPFCVAIGGLGDHFDARRAEIEARCRMILNGVRSP